MWEAIGKILTSEQADNAFHFLFVVICVSVCVLLVFLIFGRKGLIKVNTKHIQIGNELTQRELIRRQVETAHTFIMSLYSKIVVDDRNAYFTKYILERVYDKAIEWIIFNHITTNPLYIQDKQETISNLVYMLGVKGEFRNPEFKKRMDSWTKELIEMLVQVKEVYK